jgi:heme/copper-type cytochrome/quinol oxidase subunit 3
MTARSGSERAASPKGRRTISPGLVFLAIALVGSAAFALYAVTVRDPSQIPLLAAGSAVLGIVFIALAAYALRLVWRAGIDGRTARALGVALGGGIAAIIGAGCLAAAIILFLLSQSSVA